jgi:SseB protein N-terminal domain
MVGAVAGLNTGGPRFAGDNGAADPHIAAVLAAYGAGQESEQAVLTALAGSRLLVPLVEAPPEAPEVAEACATGDAHDDGCDHRAARELAFPTLIGRDGRPALLAFTSLAALVSWRPEARPVPTPAEQVWGTAVADSSAVVIDVAGPVPIAVDGARLAALAAGAPPPDPHNDPDLQADVAAALASLPAIVGAELAAGPDGTDLAVRLLIRPVPRVPLDTRDQPAVQAAMQQAVREAVQQAAEAIAGRLAGRLRRGIQFSAVLAPATAASAVSPAPVPSRSHG